MRAHFCALSPDDVKFILCATAMPTAALAQALRRMAADELTGVYEGHALRELTDEGAR